jgi:hypothetical protein
LEVSVHAIGYPPLYGGEWELRLNGIGGANLLRRQQFTFKPDLEAGARRFEHKHDDQDEYD